MEDRITTDKDLPNDPPAYIIKKHLSHTLHFKLVATEDEGNGGAAGIDLLPPLLFKLDSNGEIALVDGHRRFNALFELGVKEFPSKILDAKNKLHCYSVFITE